MPKALERRLKRQATKKGLKGKRANAYTYGTMRKLAVDYQPTTKIRGKTLLICGTI